MIYIDRSKIPYPSVLSGPRVQEARAEAEAYFTSAVIPGQKRFEFDNSWYREVRSVLSDALHHKCAYCEIFVDELPDMEHFRPIRSVAEDRNHLGYWWLAYEWSNLLIACRRCNAGKGNRFPVETENLRARRPGDEVSEPRLLLDPCEDDPSQHLVFGTDGTVSSETPRGQTTIAVLDLNRPDLIARRLAKVKAILAELQLLESNPGPSSWLERLDQYVGASSEFAALGRQIIYPVLARRQTQEQTQGLTEEWQEATPIISHRKRRQVKQSFRHFEVEQSTYSLESKAGREKFRLQRRAIEAVHLKNFKSLDEVSLEVEAGAEMRSSWLMLLGENGTGKSSILQAIAMTLMGTDYLVQVLEEQGLGFADFVKRGRRTATVSVKLSGFIGPHTLTITPDQALLRLPTGEASIIRAADGKFDASGPKTEVPLVLLGYGATRLLRHKDDEHYGNPNCRIDNLFDPLKALLNAEGWLLGLTRKNFDLVALVLKDLLALSDEATLERGLGRVRVHTNGVRVTLRQLSDGYQSVIAMSVDILEVAMRLWPHAEFAEGIVLLDEIGSHLHPTWRMRIVNSLRRAFPRLQFLVTTHEPLCLRGIGAGEVVVLRRDENGRVIAIKDLPSPADFRIDQLLTSEFFGLNSTTDPDTEAIFDEYYALKALAVRTDEQQVRLDELTRALRDRRYIGETPREQLMFEAIDQLLSQQRTAARIPIPELKEAAVAEVARLWEEA